MRKKEKSGFFLTNLLPVCECLPPQSDQYARSLPSPPSTADSRPPGFYPARQHQKASQDVGVNPTNENLKKKLQTDACMTSTNLQHVVAISIKGSLSQFDHEDAVGATGLLVQAGVGNLPFLLTWKKTGETPREPIRTFTLQQKNSLAGVIILLREKINRCHFLARAAPEASNARSVTSTIILAEFSPPSSSS